MEVTGETPAVVQSASSGSGCPAPPLAETKAGGDEKPDDPLLLRLERMFESSQLAVSRSVEIQLGPVMTSLREMRVNAATKSDLEIFEQEIRQEVEARLNQEAQGIKRENPKTDPFTIKDPWPTKGGAWGNYQPTSASSSGPAHPDQREIPLRSHMASGDQMGRQRRRP